MQRVAVAVVVALLLAGGGIAALPASAQSGGFGALQTGDVDPDTVVLTADVRGNGDAVWTIEYRVRLDDENTTAAFESLQTDIRINRSAYADQFASRMRSTVAAAENATGRQMGVQNVSVSAEVRSIPQEYGVVTYRFRWTNFAGTSDDRLLVGDALSGFFLDEETRLTISWPTAYSLADVSPPADDRTDTSVTWTGPQDFSGDQPRLVLERGGRLPVALPVSVPVAIGAAVVVLGGLVALVWVRRRGAGGATAGGGSGRGVGGGTAGGEEAPAGGGAGGGATAEGGGGEAAPPDELLSPEERVLKLLRQRGGRMKQKEITDELDWSAARTSQVVGDLRDAGEVETFRIGRENVLRIPDEDEEGMP